MRIKDIKTGGWIRYSVHNSNDNYDEIAQVVAFKHYKDVTNGYCFHLQGQDYGRLFERKEFKYSDNASDLLKNGETVFKLGQHYLIGEVLTKEDFLNGDEE